MGRNHEKDETEAVRCRRRALTDRVEGLSTLLTCRSDMPTERDLDDLEQTTAATLDAMAALLDAIDGALTGSGGDIPRTSVGSLHEALGLGAGAPPAWQRCLAELYGFVCERNDALHEAVTEDARTAFDLSPLLTPKPGTDLARWAAFVDCWTRVAYLGSTHAAGGLARRIATHPLDIVSLTHPSRGYRRLWDRADLEALRALASRIHQNNGALRLPKRLPDDDRSVAVERIEGLIAVRLAAPVPRGADKGVARRVSAIEVPDPSAPATWRVMLATTGWKARLGFGVGEPLPLVVTLPSGYALPLEVGDIVTLRAFHAVVGIHPRHGVEVRVKGRAVLVEGDDNFLQGLGGVTVTKGPCTDPGKSRAGLAPLQTGLVRVELDGVAGYSDDARRPRVLETPSDRVLFAGSWTGFGAGNLPPDASPRTFLALARQA